MPLWNSAGKHAVHSVRHLAKVARGGAWRQPPTAAKARRTNRCRRPLTGVDEATAKTRRTGEPLPTAPAGPGAACARPSASLTLRLNNDYSALYYT
jgi:hypothetical protein